MAIVCSALGGVIQSNVFSWFVDQTGIASNVAKTAVPFFQGACLFGAINGSLEYSSSTLSKRVKRDWMSNKPELKKGIDFLQVAFTLASRYAVAITCNEVFGTQISTRYVHLLNALDALAYTSSSSKTIILLTGVTTAIFAKCVSLAVTAPSFKNAYYFGVINAGIYGTLFNNHQRVYALVKDATGIEDPRVLLVSNIALAAILSGLSYYASATLSKKYCNISIFKGYIAASMILSFPLFLIGGFLNHIANDFLLADFEEIHGEVAQRKPEAKKFVDQLKEVVEHANPHLDRNMVQRQIQEGLLNEEWGALRNGNVGPQLRNLWSDIHTNWRRGVSPQNILIEALVSQSNSEAFDPILRGCCKAFAPDWIHGQGANFIAQDVLENASAQTLAAFRARDEGRTTVQFVTTQAVCIYTVGDKKEEEIPYFFSLQTIQGIRELRAQLSANPDQNQHYEAVAQKLSASAAENTEENFFSFDVSEDEGTALQRLVEIGTNPHQAMFTQTCYNLAVQQLG